MSSLSTRLAAWLIVLAVLAVFAALASPPAAAFCGFYVGKADASLFNEASQVILVRRDDRTVISMANDYRGELTEFALVVPVPQVLERGRSTSASGSCSSASTRTARRGSPNTTTPIRARCAHGRRWTAATRRSRRPRRWEA